MTTTTYQILITEVTTEVDGPNRGASYSRTIYLHSDLDRKPDLAPIRAAFGDGQIAEKEPV